MSLLADGHRIPLAQLAAHRQAAWARQADYVAANSPFFQRLWDGKAPPARLEDLPELPFSDKAGLRLSQPAHPPFGDYLAAPREAVSRLHRTSGTTGQAMNLAMSARDCAITEAVGGRAQSLAGLRPGMTVVHCLNYQMWMGGLTDHLTLERTGATVVPFGVGSTELLVRTILDIGIDAISCTPSYPAVLERVLAEKFPHLAPADLGLRLGLFGGEPGLDDPAFRQRIRDTWGMEPRNANYGVSDVFCNFAAQCAHETDLHFVAHDVLHVELIDPDSGTPKPLEGGAEGELVLTHLDRECQPLVRFRTGDIVAVRGTEPCACGCTGFRFRVVGRSDDMVVVRGLNMFPTMVAAVVGGFAELSGDYRIVLDAPPPHDVLPVQAELARGQADDGTLVPRLEAELKRRLGASAKATIVPAGTFPATEGKTRRVIRTYA
ncbi:phenylacetate--CoA ligase family protein [Roseibacterium sp. SDUM158017]|uniref:phenylacetate--CoA ligase family protein n=1 Tax=Roseicyclus salinarum TaxID=3036773 RepID=UPI0024158FD6|nr:phenylacetate--CoA ligase family protein [Roseibacterium sp. SDUM158017]MDG4647854.1 phenylacetate--CoA ligase family protein [Roseibacterium sp. SDUM158017]